MRLFPFILLAGLLAAACAREPTPQSHQLLLAQPDKPPVKEPPGAAAILLIGTEKFEGRQPDGRLKFAYWRNNTSCESPGRCIDLARQTPKPDTPKQLQDLWSDRLDDKTHILISHAISLDIEGRCADVPWSSYASKSCDTEEGRLGVSTANVEESWRQLEPGGEIHKQIKSMIEREKPTHVFVLATGWRVSQRDSAPWLTDWAKGISGAVDSGTFKPVFIAITWPAYRFDEVLSFRNKRHDADEVGLTWGNVLVNRTLAGMPGRDRFSVVLVGHSFGARLLSTAAASGGLIGAPCAKGLSADLLIGMQPAFSSGRFTAAEGRDAGAYLPMMTCGTKAVYTASTNDGAVTWATSHWFAKTKYMGGGATLAQLRAGRLPNVVVLEPGSDTRPDTFKAMLIDGSTWICGHSDVQEPLAGWQIARLLQKLDDRAADIRLKKAPEDTCDKR